MGATPSQADLDRYLEPEDTAAPRVAWRTVRAFLRAVGSHPRLLVPGLLLVLLATATELVEPRLFGYAIDAAIVPGNLPLLTRLALLFLLLSATRFAAQAGEAYLFEALGQNVTHDLRTAVFTRFMHLPAEVYDRTPSGRLLTRVTNDTAALGEVFTAGLVTILGNALLVIGIVIWLLVLDLRLALIALTVFPAMLFATARFSRKLQRSYREARSRLSAANAYLAENLMGMKVVQLFNREEAHVARYGRLNQWYADAQTDTIRTYALFQPSITLSAGISMALVIVFGGRAVLDGRLQIGVLVAFFAYTLALFRPLRDMTDKWNVLLAGMAAAERLFGVLEWPVEDAAGAGLPDRAVPYADLRGEITFEHVWFAYEGERWVLKDVSFSIPAGERLALVGHTGSGKTTIISLLMRFYEPQRGRILIDGRDLREYDRRRLRSTVGFVQQDVLLFSGTIEDNVRGFAADHVDPAPMLEALGLPPGRELSERGANLSAGERQLVAFARAHVRRPRAWILDEATSSMDAASETRLEQALARSAQGRTLILIAHRVATTRMCDRIVVLNHGRIVESGTHPELMRLDGLYARLFRYQQTEH